MTEQGVFIQQVKKKRGQEFEREQDVVTGKHLEGIRGRGK